MKNEIPDVPAEIQLAMSVNPVKREYLTWRVAVYRPDGSYYFVPHRSGYDYKLKRNAEKEAELRNNAFLKNSPAFAVVKRIKITEIEVD